MATEHLSVKIHGRNRMTAEQRRRDKKDKATTILI